MKETVFFVNMIKWMAVCDTIFCFIGGEQLLSVATNHDSFTNTLNSNYPAVVCAIKGFIFQYFTVASASWNFVLGIILYTILHFHHSLEQIAKTTQYYHVFVWYVCDMQYMLYVFVYLFILQF